MVECFCYSFSLISQYQHQVYSIDVHCISPRRQIPLRGIVPPQNATARASTVASIPQYQHRDETHAKACGGVSPASRKSSPRRDGTDMLARQYHLSSGRSTVGSAPGLGPGGPQFESARPDQNKRTIFGWFFYSVTKRRLKLAEGRSLPRFRRGEQRTK